MAFFVRKMEWEYGEKFGHVYFPINNEDVQTKLQELESLPNKNKLPFYVEFYFEDDSYLGLIVGHKFSSFIFGIHVNQADIVNNNQTLFDTHYNDSLKDNKFFMEYSFKGSDGEKHLAELLPKEMAFKALFTYIKERHFPSYIHFTREKFSQSFISKDMNNNSN